MKVVTISEFVRLSPRSKKALRRHRCGERRGRRREKRRTFSRDELLDFLRTNNIRSTRQLESGRSEGDPKIWEYKKEFGSWSEAKRMAFASDPFTCKGGTDEEIGSIIMSAVLVYKIKTTTEYKKLHAEKPEVIPPICHVYKIFKHWDTLMALKAQRDLNVIVEGYLKLVRRAGGNPSKVSIKEAEENEVYIREHIRVHHNGRKKSFDDWVMGGAK